MGGTSVVSDAVLHQLTAFATRCAVLRGPDRYATAANLSASTFAANSVGTAYVASGTSFPDGLAVGPVAGQERLAATARAVELPAAPASRQSSGGSIRRGSSSSAAPPW